MADIVARRAGVGQPARESPVKVFILAGQSNMDGQGVISGPQKGTLETLVKDPVSAPRYKHLVDKDGKWVVRDDVWCVFGDNKGKLTVGGFATGGHRPRTGVQLGGRRLSRQPGAPNQSRGGRHEPCRSMAAAEFPAEKPGGCTRRCSIRRKTCRQPSRRTSPTTSKGYELAGFGWHQGWNDGCAKATAEEYEKNMVNFIRDIRKDLGIPNLPFVIGSSGFGGKEQKNSAG